MQAVFIDALNLAYWCGRKPSLRVPLAVAIHLLTRNRQAQLYFDASARRRLADESELYSKLVQFPVCCVVVPKGIPADREILKQANRHNALILSRDKFRDHRKRFRRLIDDPTRLVSGNVHNDRLLIPGLAIDIPLPTSAQAALEELREAVNPGDTISIDNAVDRTTQ